MERPRTRLPSRHAPVLSRLYAWFERSAIFILATAAVGAIGIAAMRWLA